MNATELMTTADWSTSTGLDVAQRSLQRSQRSLDAERSEVSDVLLLGAPLMFVVLALTGMCCVVLMRWKMQDRRRRRQVATEISHPTPTTTQGRRHDSFLHTVQQADGTGGRFDEVFLRVLVNNNNDDHMPTQHSSLSSSSSPYYHHRHRLHHLTTRPNARDPPPSYDVALIYSYREGADVQLPVLPQCSPQGPGSVVGELESVIRRPPAYSDAVTTSYPCPSYHQHQQRHYQGC